MSYEDKIRKEILGGEPIRGDIRRFHLDMLLKMAREADKEISNLKLEIEADDRNVNDLMDQVDSLDKEIESKDKLIGELKTRIPEILKGIDKDELFDSGWWATSEGANFGLSKLNEIMKLFNEGDK